MTKLEASYNQAQDVIERRVHLDTTKDPVMNRNNLPSVGLQFGLLTRESRNNCATAVRDIVETLKESYSARVRREICILRSGILDDERDLKAVHRTIEQTLQNAGKLLDDLYKWYERLHQEYNATNSFTESSKTNFVVATRKFVVFNEKIVRLHELCLQYPNTGIPQIQQFTQELTLSQNSWESLLSILSVFFVSKENGNHPATSNYHKLLAQAVTAIRTLQKTYRKVAIAQDRVAEFEAFSAKDEHKTANEQISKSFASLVTQFGRFAGFIEEIKNTVTRDIESPVRGIKQRLVA